MDRETYDTYLAKFNAHNYHGVLDFYADEFEVSFAGISLRGREQLLQFYGFLHQYLKENIVVDEFVADDRLLVIEARVRIEGIRELTPTILTQAGYPKLFPLSAGQVIEIPQFIHYRIENGKFVKAICVVVTP